MLSGNTIISRNHFFNCFWQFKFYRFFDKLYVEKYYPKHKIIRTVVLYGSSEEKTVEIEIGFLLNENGKLILGVKAPKLFQEAIKNLLDYWKM